MNRHSSTRQTLIASSSRRTLAARRITTLALVAACAFAGVSCGGDSGPTSPTGGSASSAASVTGLILGVPPAAQASGFLQVAAFAQYSNMTMADVTRTATWTSSNSQVAVLTTFGGLPAFQTLRSGSVTITASFGGRSASQVVAVQ